MFPESELNLTYLLVSHRPLHVASILLPLHLHSHFDLYFFLHFCIDKPAQTVLVGEALARAEKIVALSKEEKNLDILVTPDTLLFHGFFNDGYKQVPEVKFKSNMSKKTRRKQISSLTGNGTTSPFSLRASLFVLN